MGKTNRLSEMVKSGLDLITQAITIYDENLNLVLANKRFQDMFQIPENLMKAGTTFEELLRFACLSGEYGAIVELMEMAGVKPSQSYCRNPNKRNTYFWKRSASFDGRPKVSRSFEENFLFRSNAFVMF